MPADVPDPSRGAERPAATPGAPSSSGGPAGGIFSSAEDRLVLMVVDPYLAWTYWDMHPRTLRLVRERAGEALRAFVIRFHEVGWVDFDGTNASGTFEVEVSEAAAGSYYASFWSPAKSLVAELGFRTADRSFLRILQSNHVDLPADVESSRYEEVFARARGLPSPLWRSRAVEGRLAIGEAPGADAALDSMREEEMISEGGGPWQGGRMQRPATGFGEGVADVPGPRPRGVEPEDLGGLQGGEGGRVAGPTSPAAEPRPQAPSDPAAPAESGERAEAPPEGAASPGWSSWVLPGGGPPVSSGETPAAPRGPRLEIHADIVIYGSARPGEEVIIDGMPVRVRSDGTFDLRFSLPLSPGSADSAAGEGGTVAPESGSERGLQDPGPEDREGGT